MSSVDVSTVSRSETSMRYEVHKTDGVTKIALKGSMGFSDYAVFRQMMTAFNVPAGHQMIFDLSHLEHVDSSGLGMLMIAGDEARKKSVQFLLKSPCGEVLRIIGLGKLNRIFEIQF